MSAQAIAGWALVALFAVSLLAEALRRRAFRRNHITLSEWLAGMRALPPLPPPTRTQEGAVGGD
jgi:hypothetical protein